MRLIKINNEWVNLDAIFSAKIDLKTCCSYMPYVFRGKLIGGDTFSIELSKSEADRISEILDNMLKEG